MSTSTTKKTRNALSAHSWIGVFLGAFLYLICISGALSVFYQEWERWEQPNIPEFTDTTPEQVQRVFDLFRQRYDAPTEHYHVVLPTSGIPRLVVEDDHIAHFVSEKGELLEIEKPLFTTLLTHLHEFLHLPSSIGVVVVSLFGAMICGLIVSGIIAHKRIIKDAFRFRRGGSGLQQNIDLHNRIGVWASPFHLIIGVTGTYFGLAGIVLVIVAQTFYGGDRDAVIGEVFTPEPELSLPLQPINVGQAYAKTLELAPDGKPIFLTVHEPNTEGQFIEVYTKIPGKLIYSENYRFKPDGTFIGTAGYQDGAVGKQAIYSLYRLHFGDFAGLPMKIVYFVLGMMLTLLATSGINIWLLKQNRTQSRLAGAWHGIVWGTPIALSISAMCVFTLQYDGVAIFWIPLLTVIAFATGFSSLTKQRLQQMAAFSLLMALVVYGIEHQAGVFAVPSLLLNIPILLYALFLLHQSKLPVPNALNGSAVGAN